MATPFAAPQLIDPTAATETALATIAHGGGCADVSLPLPVLAGPALERWPATGPLTTGSSDGIDWRCDGANLFFSLVAEAGDIERAAFDAYRRLRELLAGREQTHLLRLWNFFPAINAGVGDEERYRRFVQGRARATEGAFAAGFPAATAIGTVDGPLRVYGLAARTPGVALENPRQVPAWRYPRRYGPVAPGFARALLVADGTLFISGTASVIGHESAHPGDAMAQFEEACANVAELCRAAAARHGPGRLRLLKIYLRDAADAERVLARARRHRDLHGAGEKRWTATQNAAVHILLLQGDICREELLVELEGVWAPDDAGR